MGDYLPFGGRKSKPQPQEVQAAWFTIHGSLRRAAAAMILQAVLLGSCAWWIYANSVGRGNALADAEGWRVVHSLLIGTVLFALLAASLAVTYPRPSGYPPHAATKRLQVARMLMLLFGAGYIIRAIELLRASHWIDHYGPGGRLKSSSDLGGFQFEGAPTWPEALGVVGAVALVGTCGVLNSYFCGKLLRELKEAMRHTKSLKGR